MNTRDAAPEAWRPVVGYEGYYEVSDQGRVRSLDRLVRHSASATKLQRGQIKKLWTGDIYIKVALSRDSQSITVNVHSLVAAAFLGPRPDELEVCHGNGDAHDNRVANLRYDTPAANAQDRIRHRQVRLVPTRRDVPRCPPPLRDACARGHEYSPENTLLKSSKGKTWRACRACQKIHAANYSKRRKAKKMTDSIRAA